MTDPQAAADNCEHHYETRILGGHPLSVRICIFCRRPDWTDLQAQVDHLLGGNEAALTQLLGGDRPASVVAHTLHFHGHSLADVRRMTDEQLLAVPGIGETSLARIRAAFPAPEPGSAVTAEVELARLRAGLHKFRYALDSRAGRETTTDFMREMLDSVLNDPGQPCDRDEQYTRAEQAEDLLRVAHETSNKSEAERVRAVKRAEAAEATVARVQAESSRIRAVTPTWGPVSDLIDAALHHSAEQDVTRVIDLYERWVKAGPPPLGVSISRWWDARLIELHNAIRPPAPGQQTGCGCHNGDEVCSGCRRCPDICNGCDGPEYSTTDRNAGRRP